MTRGQQRMALRMAAMGMTVSMTNVVLAKLDGPDDLVAQPTRHAIVHPDGSYCLVVMGDRKEAP